MVFRVGLNILIIGILFFSPAALAHFEAGNVGINASGTIVDPEIFVSGETTTVFLEIKDNKTGKKVSGLEVEIEIFDESEKEIFKAPAEAKGENYSFKYAFPEKGVYQVVAEFSYKDKEESLGFEIDAVKPVKTMDAVSIIILIIAALLIIIDIFAGFKTKKFKPAAVWFIIIVVAAGLAYSLNITLSQKSPWILVCPGENQCYLTAHIHAYVPIQICGEDYRLPTEVGNLGKPHTHEEKNIIHWHDKLPFDREAQKLLETQPLTLGVFFDEIKIDFDKDKIINKKNGEFCPDKKPGSVKVFINGVTAKPESARDYIWNDKDVIQIFFDSRTETETMEEIKKNQIQFPALGRG